MADNEGPVEQPPSAWVWSQYRGVLPADSPVETALVDSPVEAQVETPPSSPAAAETKNSSMIGLGVAAAVIVIAGLTWLFATKPASEPAAPETPPAATDAPQKSEAAPDPAAEPAATAAPAPATAQDAPKPAEPAPAPQHGAKKKKHK